MRAVIVYESLFGNTHRIAQAISEGIREADARAETLCLPAAQATPDLVQDPDLLVVGGPTHIRGMTSRFSRKMGRKTEGKADAKPEPDAGGPGLRGWFDSVPRPRSGRSAAAFDTRLDSRMAGGAAAGIARRLRAHGYLLTAEPEGFIVEDAAGPLRAGELDRAKAWGATLCRRAAVLVS
jgi:hypothetical protein